MNKHELMTYLMNKAITAASDVRCEYGYEINILPYFQDDSTTITFSIGEFGVGREFNYSEFCQMYHPEGAIDYEIKSMIDGLASKFE